MRKASALARLSAGVEWRRVTLASSAYLGRRVEAIGWMERNVPSNIIKR